eukprot:14671347-Ditylum_brightwellii.AAC.1
MDPLQHDPYSKSLIFPASSQCNKRSTRETRTTFHAYNTAKNGIYSRLSQGITIWILPVHGT